jgi:tRNA threonylcarbamoyl adenosine modification protein (Sua5/YciO/YrdC/YwlC family)
MQLLRIHPEDPPRRLLHQVVTVLRQGGVIIYPTDTVYGLGCDITNKKAVHQICRIKGFEPGKQYLTCVCENLKIIGSYARHVSTPVYKMMRQAIPGPYTFVLQASKEIPKHFQAKKNGRHPGARSQDPYPTGRDAGQSHRVYQFARSRRPCLLHRSGTDR